MTPIAIDAQTNLRSVLLQPRNRKRKNADSQRVLDEHTGTSTHHGALTKDILLLIPFWCEGEVVGHEPGVSFLHFHTWSQWHSPTVLTCPAWGLTCLELVR